MEYLTYGSKDKLIKRFLRLSNHRREVELEEGICVDPELDLIFDWLCDHNIRTMNDSSGKWYLREEKIRYYYE